MSRNDERASKEMYEQRTAMLHFPIRQELVGKRFIVITEEATRRGAKNQDLENYSWKQGYIRACSVKDILDKELQVLVEFDGSSWEYRQWIKIYEQTKAFFVENTVVWAARIYRGSNTHRSTISWPALIFVPIVDHVGFDKDSRHPVEYFGDKQLAFLKENEVGLFKDSEESLNQVFCINAQVQEDLLGWQRLQKTQACLMKGAETLTGARVTVYRLELRQWYTGCITAHNLTTRELHVMDDNVLQTHPVDPALVQINLMAHDDELLRILHGEQSKTRRQRNAQIYFQANCPEQKPQAGVTNWHVVRDLNAPQPKPGWSRPSVVRTVSHGKTAFVPSVGPDLDGSQETSPQSFPKQNDPVSSSRQKNAGKTSGSHSTAKVKVHKPIPVVLKLQDTLPFPHYAPQPARSSTSPLLSSLTSTPSPLRAQLTPSPLSGQHTPSPHSLSNQTPPQNSRNESPFNIALCDQSSARVAAEKELARTRNHENSRTNHNSQSTPMTSSRKSSVIETADKANSRLVPSPSIPSHPMQLFATNTEGGNCPNFTLTIETTRKTPPQITTGVIPSESPSDENPVRNSSPESEAPSTALAESSRNFVPGVKTHRKKKKPRTKTAPIAKVIHPTVVIDDAPSQSTVETTTQQRSTNNLQNTVISTERGHSSRMENERARNSCRMESGVTKNVHTNPIITQTKNMQARGTQFSNTQERSHFTEIQSEYLRVMEALVRFQYSMIIEAYDTINQTRTEEQRSSVTDTFCKLVEQNRHTGNIFCEASFARQERQRVEHERHMSQGTAASPNRVTGCLPEEIERRLRSAEEAVDRGRKEVISVVLPFEERQQKKGQHMEWEVLKQQLQKQQKALHNEKIKKHHHVEEKTQPARQGQAEAQKQNHLQGQQQRQDKTQHHSLPGVFPLYSDSSSQVELLKETEQQLKQAPAPEEPQQASRTQVQPSVMQSTPQQANPLLHASRSQLLRTPENFQQLQQLLLQRAQLYEQQRYEEVQRKRVNELLQVKDVEQKTILLQDIVDALESQKASSRDVLKSPPAINSNFGNRSTESQLTKVQTKQSQFAAPSEANPAQAQQHIPKPPFLSADQLLSSLTTATARRVTENLAIAPGLISENQPAAGNTQVSGNSEKSNSALVMKKEKPGIYLLSGSTPIIPDITSCVDMLGEAGSKKDKLGSAKASKNKTSGKKRKTSSLLTPGDSETLPKPKRQRKSTKKKNVSDIASRDIASSGPPPGCVSIKQERLPVKSVPPGEVLPVAMTSGDRNVTPVKTNDDQFSHSHYQPRSITKGIGFIPVNPVHEVGSTVTNASVTSTASDSLDVLASVSVSRSVQDTQDVRRPAVTSVIQSCIGKNRLPHDGSRQFADENRRRSDSNPQLGKTNRQLFDDFPTSTNGNRQLTDEKQQHTSDPSKSANAARLGSESVPTSADTTQVTEVGVCHTTTDRSQMFSDGKQSHNECNQPATERSVERNIGEEDVQCGVKDKTDPISDQLVKIQIAPNPSQMVKDKSVDISSVGLNGSVNKTKKPRKERQKKERKKKIQAPGSAVETTFKTKDGLPAVGPNVPQEMSLLYLFKGEQNIGENKSNEVLCEPVRQLSSTRDDENKAKLTSQNVNALSLDHGGQNDGNAATVKSADITMKETDEAPELSTLKNVVFGSLKNSDIPKQSAEMEAQDSSKPVDSTFAVISQNIQALNLDYSETSLYNKSTDETPKVKQKKKEISSGKKSGKKESKSKPDGSKTKKTSEKKPKTPRGNKQEKETVAKSGKKSSKVKHDKVLTKLTEIDKKQPHNLITDGDLGNIFANVDTVRLSSGSEETTTLKLSENENNATKLPATTSSDGECSDNKVIVNSLEQLAVSAKESKKSDDKAADNKSTQPVDNTKDVCSILLKSLNSELESLRNNKDDNTTVENTSEIAGKLSVAEAPKKQKKKKTDLSKPQTKKSASEKAKKKPAKDEKSTKNNKKASKKSEKNNIKSLENSSVTVKSENEKGTACVAKDSVMAVDEFVSSAADASEQKSLVQEQGKEQADEATNSVTLELASTDAVVEANGIEKRRESEDIVFVNDKSVGNFVNARKEEENVFSESLLSRKRKRCTSLERNDSVVSESSDVESCAPVVCHETAGTESNQASSKKPSSRKSSENGEKKESKIRKKKVKKENETKNESAITLETDTSALDGSMKQDEKKESGAEAKKKVKKPKDPKEKKVREKIQKEEWVYFLQRGGCKALPSMPQCRECRNYETEEEAVLNKSCCRFHMFRRCRSKSNRLEMAGFSSSEHAQGDDLLPWIAGEEIGKLLSLEVSKYILLNVGDEFCKLVKKEEEVFSWDTKKGTVAWKRAVRGIREMCDACATTIFNVHWVCPKCGFGVCLDCYRTKLNMAVNSAEAGRAKRFLWVRCSANTGHRPQRLVLTHIIPKKTLHEVGEQLHEAREFWGIGKNCPCKSQREELKDSATIKELPDEDQHIVVDVVGDDLSLQSQVTIEATESVEQNSEIPMEIESAKISEEGNEAMITSKDANEMLVKTEIQNSSESVTLDVQSEDAGNILPESKASETSECQAGKEPEVGKSVELEQECQADKSPEDEKGPGCKDNILPASQNISAICEADKPPESEVDKQPECDDNKPPKSKACEEKSSDVRLVGDHIGALSLLMDYESPVSSPMPSPVREIEDDTEISPVEETLLSRPHATHGESSATTDPPSAMTDAPSTTTDETLAMTDETSQMTGETSPMTGETSAMTGETSAMTDETLAKTEASHEDIIARVEARTTDEVPAPHSWICRRPMLRLHNAHHEGNLMAFQSRWQKGEPVLVSGVDKNMTSHLWTPEGFENEFGSEKADVVNCKTGGTLEKMEIGTFWRGFESVKDRPLDSKGEPTLLKLKDWPPEADFVEKMPTRFKDLMDALPLPEYTRRDGSRNLVSRLPDFFVTPDLGPKMYNAYGNAAFPSAGTTNLHIDMSDAVNVMVYVGVPFDEAYGEQERRDSIACIDGSCDETQKYRARGRAEKLGALWHIFAAEDANKIRALFHKVCREKNMKYPASHDPIHDQCFYLNEPLLKRLKDEYGVVGWPIAQFLGDAIFIPAGAPHQVRNLHSCVKAAEDFVSPEHVGHCFKLTEEFRHLSEKHTNHEDKLQVKNIIYHAVKDAVSVLRQHEIASQTEEAGNENV